MHQQSFAIVSFNDYYVIQCDYYALAAHSPLSHH